MRLQTFIKAGGALLLTGLLAACGGSNNTATPVPPPAHTSLESQFGTEFAMIFDASSTSQPATPSVNAVPALAPTAQPIAFPS